MHKIKRLKLDKADSWQYHVVQYIPCLVDFFDKRYSHRNALLKACTWTMWITWISMFFAAATGLTLIERNEISRKFKYYFKSVRPTAPDNFITAANGTFYRITAKIDLISTHIKADFVLFFVYMLYNTCAVFAYCCYSRYSKTMFMNAKRSLLVSAIVAFHWVDDRLMLRELFNDFELPKDFEPWLPRLRTTPEPHTVTVVLSPATGLLSLYHRIKDILSCSSNDWKYPFESFDCELSTEDVGDEVITVVNVEDLRSEEQSMRVEAVLESFAQATLHLKYSSDWHLAALSTFLPSLLIVVFAFFAQWKRRKIQVLVSLAAIICMLILLVSSRRYNSMTLLDFWNCGCFIHTVFLLVIDLTLPARKVKRMPLFDVERRDGIQRNAVSISPKLMLAHRKPPYLAMNMTQHLAGKAFCLKLKDGYSTQIAALPSNSGLTHWQVVTTDLGEKKKFALLVVATCYIAFMLVYCTTVYFIH